MHRLFGKAPAPAPATTAPTHGVPALHTMTETRDLLDKREAHVLRLIDTEIENARSFQARNNKREALECIKRKKLHDKELERISSQKLNLMQTEQTLQALRLNNIVMDASAAGASAIEREIKRSGGAEGVDRAHDRLEDNLDLARDVLEASSRVMGDAGQLDEAELLDELDALELAAELGDIDLGPEAQRSQDARHGAAAQVHGAVAPGPTFAQVPRTVPAVGGAASSSSSAASAARAAAQKAAREAEEERELARLAEGMKTEQAMPMPMMAAVGKMEHPRPMQMEHAMAAMPMMAAVF